MFRCADRHLHALALLREKVERFRRRPVVDEDHRPLRARDQLQHQRPRIPQLPVVEHALDRRNLRLHEEIDLLLKGGDAVIVLGKAAVNLVFKQSKTLVYHLAVQKIFLQNTRSPLPKLNAQP